MMDFTPKIVDYIALIDTRQTSDSADIQKLAEKLKEIGRDWKVEIVSADNTDWFDRIDNGERFDYCLHDLEAQRSFCNHIHNMERVKRRRQLRHVPRGQRNMEPKRRKAYRPKKSMSYSETVLSVERGGLTYHFLKSRNGTESLGICFNPSNGHDVGKIQAIHDS